MKNRNVFFALALAILLLVFGVWLLTFFRSTLVTKRLAAEDVGTSKQSFAAPSGQPFSIRRALRTRRKASGRK